MSRTIDKNSVAQKARNAGIPSSVVYARLYKGWKLKKALGTPVRKHTPKEVTIGKHAKRTPPKIETPVDIPIQHYRSDRPSKLVWIGLSALVIMLLITIMYR